MKLHEFFIICRDCNLLLDFLIDRKVLPSVRKCPNCNNNMVLVRDELTFRCRRVYYVQNSKRKRIKRKCDIKISIFKGTWFESAHLPLQKSCQFIAYHLMLRPPRQQFLQFELDISAHTVVDWASFCREVCILWAEKNSEQLGGENVIVEIDEAKIGKRKFNKGRLVTGQWVFGGIERLSGQIFVQSVADRSSATLLKVIRKWIKPGTTIMSDSWKSYNCLNDCGFKHLKINHKINFVDPDSGAHTQNIERAWRETRANIPRYGTRQKHYEYLAEFQFRRKYNFDSRITAFFNAMAEIFQIPNDNAE